jgi:hypothetical protein
VIPVDSAEACLLSKTLLPLGANRTVDYQLNTAPPDCPRRRSSHHPSDTDGNRLAECAPTDDPQFDLVWRKGKSGTTQASDYIERAQRRRASGSDELDGSWSMDGRGSEVSQAYVLDAPEVP